MIGDYVKALEELVEKHERETIKKIEEILFKSKNEEIEVNNN